MVDDDDVLLRRRTKLALNGLQVQNMVRTWLLEDCPGMDYAACTAGDTQESAVILYKDKGDDDGVLAGVPFVEALFAQLNCSCRWTDDITDGSTLRFGQRVCVVDGRASDLLRGERVALNCLSRASGVSTAARRAVALARSANWSGRIAGTRKTTPGFRLVEKYGLSIGGADPHRHDLSSMVMLKDNHVWASCNVKRAVSVSRQLAGFSVLIEVECRTLSEARDAANAGANVIMLDNFHPEAVQEVAKKLKAEFPSIVIEVSGGVNEFNLLQFLGPEVDVVSISALTQNYRSLDFSFKLLKEGRDPYNPLVMPLSSTTTTTTTSITTTNP